jgi:hypothetical protein
MPAKECLPDADKKRFTKRLPQDPEKSRKNAPNCRFYKGFTAFFY